MTRVMYNNRFCIKMCEIEEKKGDGYTRRLYTTMRSTRRALSQIVISLCGSVVARHTLYTKRSFLRKVDCPALNVRPDVPRARGGACTCAARREGLMRANIRSVPNSRGAILSSAVIFAMQGKRNDE